MKYISFKTLRKSRAVIIRQPFISTVRFPSGNNKGKIKSQHKCQYNEEQTTIRMDEQVSPDPNLAVLPTPLFIMRGIRNVGEDENLIIDALRAHPDNIANGGKLFKEYDISTEELLQLEGFDKEDECKQLLKTSEANIVRSCAVWFLGNKFLSKDISTNTMKLALRRAIEMNVEVPGTDGAVFVDAFMAFMKDKGNSEKLLAALAIQEGILNITGGRKIVWGDTNELVFNGSQAQEVVREFAIWMKNDKEGREIAKILSEKVKTIKDN